MRPPAIAFILSFTLGIAVASLTTIPVSYLFFLLFLYFILLFWYAYARAKGVLVVSLCILGFAFGVFRFSVSTLNETAASFERLSGTTVSIRGIIAEEPDVRDQSIRLIIRTSSITGGNETAETDSRKILASAPSYPEWSYGDEVSVIGKLRKPEAFEGSNGKLFDYPGYLSVKGVHYEIPFADVELIAVGKGNPVRAALFSIKKKFIEQVGFLLEEPESSLLAGLTVGAKQSLGAELLDKFRRVGLIHVVVLSGYNITIIADSILALFSSLRPALAASFASVSIIIFAVMVGGGATVARATIMALLVILARRTGRLYDVTVALLLAGFAMLLHNPKILMFDPSFQLSFLATVGLIYFSPMVERRLKWVTKRFLLRDVAVATLSTQLFVLPFLVYQMGQFSIAALPVNILTLVFVPATMLFGFLAGAVGFVSTLLAVPFAFVAHLLLSYQLAVVELFSKFSFSAVSVSSVPFFAVIGTYLVYGILIYRNRKIPVAAIA